MTVLHPHIVRIAIVAVASAASLACGCGDDDQGDGAAGFDCDSVGARSEELREGTLSCERDEDCLLVSIDAPCLGDFLCQTIVNADTDVDDLRREAGQLAEDYMTHCVGRDGYGCAIADCANPDELELTCVDRTCTITR